MVALRCISFTELYIARSPNNIFIKTKSKVVLLTLTCLNSKTLYYGVYNLQLDQLLKRQEKEPDKIIDEASYPRKIKKYKPSKTQTGFNQENGLHQTCSTTWEFYFLKNPFTHLKFDLVMQETFD